MAEPQKNEVVATPASQIVGFTFIKLVKDEVLGSGSFGTVYKARCDDLVCAAKILHLAAVHQSSKNGRFERECEFLSSFSHPNIVLFLGTFRDRDTNFPVVLMELMDESLTRFLGNVQEPLPFNIEVNICHDIALALSFLHSNGIIHRNLSSNNVLMIGNVRAKVTDFGMVQLWNTINRGALAKHPGNAYMPPEVDRMYSYKLDCFSFGVLSIQILTSCFPQPSDLYQIVIESNLKLRVSEIERRRNHLDLIPSDHPILPLAVRCIQDKGVNRPSSRDLCSRLLDMKMSSRYSERSTRLKASTTETVLDDIDKLVREMQCFPEPSEGVSVSLHSTSRGDSMEPSEFRSTEGQLTSVEQAAASEEIKWLKRELEKALELLKDQIQERESVVSTVDERTMFISGEGRSHTSSLEIETHVTSNQILSQQPLPPLPPLRTCSLSEPNHQETVRPSEITEHETEKTQEQQQQQSTIYYLTKELEIASQQLKVKDQLLQESEQLSQELKKEMRLLVKKLAVRERACSYVPLRKVTLRWKGEAKTPLPVSRSTEAIITSGTTIFIRPGGTREVHAYNIGTNSWSKFPDVSVKDCSLTLIKKNLTIVGGKMVTNQFTNKVMSLIMSGGTKKWVEIYPRMEVKRSNVITVYCQMTLIAAGGENELGFIQAVEILDTSCSAENLAWSRVADLPDPLAMASATLCGGHLYLLGGWVDKMSPSYGVYSASISSLVQPQSTENPWKTIASLPTKGSSCVSAKGRLLAVGGRDIHQPTTTIHIYNPVSDSWELLSNMLQPRHQCFACVVDEQLVVMGGWVLNRKQLLTETKTVEFAEIL